MKFGVNTWVWLSPLTIDKLETLAPLVSDLGFDWIEMPIEVIDQFDYGRASEIARENGLEASLCVAMGPDRDLVHPDEAIRENGMAYLRHCIDAAGIMGVSNIVGPMYSAVGRVWQATAEERARDTELLVRNLGQLAEYAGERDAVLGVEPLNRFETSFINLAEQIVEVVDRVDHPSCRIMLDTFHMNIEEKSVGDAIRAAGSRLCHFHACENDRGAPGSGLVHWDDVAQALGDIHYDGPVVIESFTPEVKSIARAAAVWRPFADSPEALASDGLAFLRPLLS
jgi:D-psicose/D-tagatose/L-ribulose 3-epimerase